VLELQFGIDKCVNHGDIEGATAALAIRISSSGAGAGAAEEREHKHRMNIFLLVDVELLGPRLLTFFYI
jgi:hypothetical protein